jgi:hypothetical protein
MPTEVLNPTREETGQNSHVENKELSIPNIEAYVKGCEEVASRLHSVIQNVIEAKKGQLY